MLLIYQKAYTMKVCQPLNVKELLNCRFGKELTLKTFVKYAYK